MVHVLYGNVPYDKRLFSALARHKSDSDLQQSLLTQQPGLQPMQQFPPLVHPQIPSSQAPPLNQKREAVSPTSFLFPPSPSPFLYLPQYLLSSLAFLIVLHHFLRLSFLTSTHMSLQKFTWPQMTLDCGESRYSNIHYTVPFHVYMYVCLHWWISREIPRRKVYCTSLNFVVFFLRRDQLLSAQLLHCSGRLHTHMITASLQHH